VGYTVEVAHDGVEAIEKLASDPSAFDVVLLDLSMPRMGGDEALGLIRDLNAELPVVLSSGYNESSSFAAEGRDKLTLFVRKPYRAQDLEDAIRLVGHGSQSTVSSRNANNLCLSLDRMRHPCASSR
jgi:two-component system cell cycle sensor histidine kinase/response regulator CckA